MKVTNPATCNHQWVVMSKNHAQCFRCGLSAVYQGGDKTPAISYKTATKKSPIMEVGAKVPPPPNDMTRRIVEDAATSAIHKLFVTNADKDATLVLSKNGKTGKNDVLVLVVRGELPVSELSKAINDVMDKWEKKSK